MRLWSIHPKYLDAKGLVALWREALLAKKVLEGRTRGYTHHPQLERFKHEAASVELINQFLSEVYQEAVRRGYGFDRSKIDWSFTSRILRVTQGQIEYETLHLLKKLQDRDPERYSHFKSEKIMAPHPMFMVIPGDIEPWEITS